ncbi:ATP-binding protein [uncultured Clostridium sp.]|uniref:ATP-binding protein n=1 Tax=uncultured Clostridium sp. TaxID=59620 RepID=UPI0025D2D3CC|nr:AAA family ATPase [uncultured Clostridium sp.]
MKIKRIHIDNFAGLNDITINLKEGFNLIYGVNESGKSSIEKFIKIWLYGIQRDENGEINREKYIPLNGGNISGELVLDYNGIGVVIKRVFGISENDDRCNVINESTGKKIKIEFPDQPGKSIFNLNYSSFIRSLFIGRNDIEKFKCMDRISIHELIYGNSHQEETSMDNISINLLEEMEHNCLKYDELINKINSKSDDLHNAEMKNEELRKVFNLYNNEKLELMGENLHEKILKLENEQKVLKHQIKEYENNEDYVKKIKTDMLKKAGSVDSIEFIGKYRNEIGTLLESYKAGLKDLKYRIENQSKHKLDRNSKDAGRKIIFTNILAALTCVIFIIGLFIKSSFLNLLSISIILLLIKKSFKYSVEIKNNKIAQKNNDLIQMAKSRVDDDEEELNIYMKETDCQGYEEFIEKITRFDKYITYKENCEIELKKREIEFKPEKMISIKRVFDKNNEFIDSVYEILSCDDMEQLLERIVKYENIKHEIEVTSKEMNRLNKEIDELESQILFFEKKVHEAKLRLGLSNSLKNGELSTKIKAVKRITSLRGSFDQIKKYLGSELDNKVLNKFNKLTSKMVDKIYINENYEIKIYDGDSVYDSNRLSNGSRSQLDLAMSLSLCEMIFKKKGVPIILANTFSEYDDIRRKKAINLLLGEGYEQIIFFTCQSMEKNILDFIDAEYEYIKI